MKYHGYLCYYEIVRYVPRGRTNRNRKTRIASYIEASSSKYIMED